MTPQSATLPDCQRFSLVPLGALANIRLRELFVDVPLTLSPRLEANVLVCFWARYIIP